MQEIKVLVIEDNPSDADLLLEIFDHSNDIQVYGEYEIQYGWVKSIEEAMERLEEYKPDIVFCDLDLGETTGIATLKNVRNFLPKAPIIVTTGYLNRKLWYEALENGADDFVLKNSINPQLILKTVFYSLARSGNPKVQELAKG